jgi:hypothetical protein
LARFSSNSTGFAGRVSLVALPSRCHSGTRAKLAGPESRASRARLALDSEFTRCARARNDEEISGKR